MIRDLVAQSGRTQEVHCDVLVVGGGTVGLLLATRLAAAGRHVVAAESGGLTQSGETHPLNDVVLLGAPYKGAASGRFRCLGGASTRWGGAMSPSLTPISPFASPAGTANGLPGSPTSRPIKARSRSSSACLKSLRSPRHHAGRDPDGSRVHSPPRQMAAVQAAQWRDAPRCADQGGKRANGLAQCDGDAVRLRSGRTNSSPLRREAAMGPGCCCARWKP